MVQAKVVWTSGKQFVGESGSGHALVLDTSFEADGRNTGPSPTELLAISLAGCTGYDVVFILKDKMRRPLTGLTVEVKAERAEISPRVFTSIELTYHLRGPELPLKDVVRAIQLSTDKYCSISAMLGKTAEIRSRYDILDEATGETFAGALGQATTDA
jgi:putative redox protein